PEEERVRETGEPLLCQELSVPARRIDIEAVGRRCAERHPPFGKPALQPADERDGIAPQFQPGPAGSMDGIGTSPTEPQNAAVVRERCLAGRRPRYPVRIPSCQIKVRGT